MKKKTILGIMFLLVLNLLLAACSSGTEKVAVSDPEYSDYAAPGFRGKIPGAGN